MCHFKMTMVIVASVIFITGCAHWETHRASQGAKYLGNPLETMYDEYGAPRGIAPLSSGGKFVEFVTYKGGFRCEASVKTDAQGKIISIQVGGQNGCITGRY